jgi:cephalosporin hydroxylase
MKLTIDTEQRLLTTEDANGLHAIPLYSDEAFRALSAEWVKIGWNQKYSYSFTWFGRPVIQLPEDMVRMQEVIASVQPDVIIETGVAHGGSLIFYASLCKALGKGRIVGIDIEIRPHNRTAIETHPLGGMISLIEGSSTDPEIVRQAGTNIRQGETVLVILDSCHTRQHVLDELDAYHQLVTPDSYIVATDGIMRDVADCPIGQPGWRTDNPSHAAVEWAGRHPEFQLQDPPFFFNESTIGWRITYWPNAYLKRVS